MTDGLHALLESSGGTVVRVRGKTIEPTLTIQAIGKLGGEGISHANIEGVEALQARLADAANLGVLANLRRRDIREGCTVFMHPPHPPGRCEVGEPLVELVQTTQRRAPFFALINAYLDAFEADDEDVAALGTQLGKLSRKWPWREGDVWPTRADAFSLFAPGKAPSVIGEFVLSQADTPVKCLSEAGLDTEARRLGGMARAAFASACRSTALLNGAAAQKNQERLIEWAGIGGSALTYPQEWPPYAQAMLVPWSNTDPDPPHRNRLIDAVVSHAGDPRVSRNKWRPVEEKVPEAYQIVLRWLTKMSVEQFFDIVSETMTDRPDMWRERRKFWTEYLKADLISAAWVAFGADGAARASRAAYQTDNPGLKLFGRISSGSGRTAEHAALIMRIGDLTIVDWSHNGRWNIWPKGSSNVPELFRTNTRGRSDYDPQELMNGPIYGIHTHNGSWKGTVRDTIRRYTGARP